MAKRCGRTNDIKRKCEQQVERESYEGEPDTFYRTFFIAYVDNLASQLQSRFNGLNTSAIRSFHL